MGKFHKLFDRYLPVTHPYFHFPTITGVNINSSHCSSYMGPSVFSFPDDNLMNINRFSPNMVYALILLRSGLGLLLGKFGQFLTELSACDMSEFSFPGDNK